MFGWDLKKKLARWMVITENRASVNTFIMWTSRVSEHDMVRKFQPLINRICSQLKLYFLYQTCDQDREYVLYIIMQKKMIIDWKTLGTLMKFYRIYLKIAFSHSRLLYASFTMLIWIMFELLSFHFFYILFCVINIYFRI